MAREGLARIGRLFALERKWKGRSPVDKQALRAQFARPHLDAFFAWAQVEYQLVKHERGLLRSALGYAVRQKDALLRYLDDGRLALDNNASERELRRIAVGRNAWLFVGSDGMPLQVQNNRLDMSDRIRMTTIREEAQVTALDSYRLRLRFDDGAEGVVDLRDVIPSKASSPACAHRATSRPFAWTRRPARSPGRAVRTFDLLMFHAAVTGRPILDEEPDAMGPLA